MAVRRLTVLILLALSASACSLVRSGTGPSPDLRPISDDPSSVDDPPQAYHETPRVGSETERIAGGVVETALQALGTPYEWGGTDANGFDCSGLIQYAFGRYGIDLPRVSVDQLRMGSQVNLSISTLQPADILGFSGKVGGKSTHVGLYVGNGEFIHSSSDGVRLSELRNPYWQQHFISARRVIR